MKIQFPLLLNRGAGYVHIDHDRCRNIGGRIVPFVRLDARKVRSINDEFHTHALVQQRTYNGVLYCTIVYLAHVLFGCGWRVGRDLARPPTILPVAFSSLEFVAEFSRFLLPVPLSIL